VRPVADSAGHPPRFSTSNVPRIAIITLPTAHAVP
jgi:hypothetical protein